MVTLRPLSLSTRGCQSYGHLEGPYPYPQEVGRAMVTLKALIPIHKGLAELCAQYIGESK